MFEQLLKGVTNTLDVPKNEFLDSITTLLVKSGYKITEVNSDKPWGAYFCVDKADMSKFLKEFFPDIKLNGELSAKILVVSPGHRLSWQYHNKRSEQWKFLHDGAYYSSDSDEYNKLQKAKVGDRAQFVCGQRHRLVGADNAYTVVAEIWRHVDVQNPSTEADVVRLSDDYNRQTIQDESMITVIIAGGSGTRLWPLSTPNHPKHLLQLTGERSMVQRTYDRARGISSKIYIVTESSHDKELKAQLPDLKDESFIVEPGRRGTASCIVAALAKINQDKSYRGQPIIFMHADHHIRDVEAFVSTAKKAGGLSRQTKRLVLLGVVPDHPATGFGYIEKGKSFDHGKLAYEVKSFTEKPDFETAQRFFTSGHYLWNMGYFVATLATFKQIMQRDASYLYDNFRKLVESKNNQEFKQTYLKFTNEPIDTALIEKVPDLLVVPGDFDWMDVGSFKDLHKANRRDKNENYTAGDVELVNVSNTYVRNDGDVPVAVIGLDNVVVVNTKHGVLVAKKDASQKVGDVAKKIQSR
ncbi:sugar phosphate nucleotidyltransferase [Candidatus Saccharibacteria bacterium]|nr:sugar phosphate nucleotidyltransferase [Candidatus Saccharibacteria bacterium]